MGEDRRVTRLKAAVVKCVKEHGSQARAADDLGVNQGLVSWILGAEDHQARFSPTLEVAMKKAGWDVGPESRTRLAADVASPEDRDIIQWWVDEVYGMTWSEYIQGPVLQAAVALADVKARPRVSFGRWLKDRMASDQGDLADNDMGPGGFLVPPGPTTEFLLWLKDQGNIDQPADVMVARWRESIGQVAEGKVNDDE